MAFPPLICRCLMQPAAVATLNCPAALLPTLVGGRSFHNGKFVAKALTFEACCVAPGIWQTRDRRKFGGKKMSNRFTQYILIAMALGIVMGTLVFNYLPDIRADIAADVNLIAMLFLRLIKMIIASFVSLLLGLIMVNLLQPGANFPGTLPDKLQSTGLPVSAFSIEKFLTHLIPTSIADAMAQNEILQIVVFAVFFSVALGAAPERAKQMLSLIDDLGHIMLKVTGYVMKFAPIAVWAAITATVAKNGLLVLWKLIVL